MVHCLYKCFCRFKAIDGPRFEFSNSKIDVIEQPIYTKKRQYTFERSKDEPLNKVSKYINTTFSPIEDTDYSSCRRVRVVATNDHKILNRARSEEIRRRVKKYEMEQPALQAILRRRVKRSVAYAEAKRHSSVLSNENQQNRSGHSIVMEKSTEKVNTSDSLPENDSLKVDANASKYRSRFNNIIMKVRLCIVYVTTKSQFLIVYFVSLDNARNQSQTEDNDCSTKSGEQSLLLYAMETFYRSI